MFKPWEIIRDGSVQVPIYRWEQRDTVAHVVAWYEGGRRFRKSFADPAEARAHARKVARGISRLGTSALTLTGEELLAYQRVRDQIGGEPIDRAFQELLEARRLTGGHVLRACSEWSRLNRQDAPPVEECVRAYVASRSALGRSAIHVRNTRYRLEAFARAFRCPMSSVDPVLLTAWLGSIKGAPRTRQNYLGAVVGLVRWCERQRMLSRGQIDLSTIELPRVNSEIHATTPEDLARILAHADRDLLPYVALQAFAGLRASEAQRVRWEDITPDHVDVKAANSKTRQRRLAPVLPVLRSWLDPIRGTGRACPLDRTDHAIARLEQAAGVQWIRNGLRHGFGTYRMAILKNEHVVALEMGNSPSMIFRHYRAIATEETARQWFGLMRAGQQIAGSCAG